MINIALIVVNTTLAFILYLMALYLVFQVLMIISDYWDMQDSPRINLVRKPPLYAVVRKCVFFVLCSSAFILTANYLMGVAAS